MEDACICFRIMSSILFSVTDIWCIYTHDPKENVSTFFFDFYIWFFEVVVSKFAFSQLWFMNWSCKDHHIFLRVVFVRVNNPAIFSFISREEITYLNFYHLINILFPRHFWLWQTTFCSLCLALLLFSTIFQSDQDFNWRSIEKDVKHDISVKFSSYNNQTTNSLKTIKHGVNEEGNE